MRQRGATRSIRLRTQAQQVTGSAGNCAGPTETTNRQVVDAMETIVKIAASIDDIPTVEETDAMLDELRRCPRDPATLKMIDELLEIRMLLGAAYETTRAE